MSWGVDDWGVSPWGGAGANLDLTLGMHVGPRVLEIRFNKRALGNAALTTPANWTVVKTAGPGPTPLTVLTVEKPLGAPNPRRVYLITQETPGDGGTYQVTAAGIVALDGAALGVSFVSVLTTGLRAIDDPNELKLLEMQNRMGAVKKWSIVAGRFWQGLVRAKSLIDGLIGGRRRVELGLDVSAATSAVATLSAGVIPMTEVPLGGSDGVNRTFRTQHTFDWRRVQPFRTPLPTVTFNTTPSFPDNWYAPGGGYERLFRWLDPPQRGSATVLYYTPTRGLVRIGAELAAFITSPSAIDLKQVTLVERGRIGTTAAAHLAKAPVYDYWGSSFIETLESALSYRTGVDTLLGVRGKDIGVERIPEDLDDRGFRRVLLNVGVGKKNTVQIFDTALQYLYRDIWRHTLVGEDPRWPNAVVVWYNADQILRGSANPANIEIWEDWLEEAVRQDGTEPTQGRTYLHADATDNEYVGSYLMEAPSDAGDDPNYPVIVSGEDIWVLGIPNPPPPPAPDPSYRGLLFKPRELERILPGGVGILLLQHPGF